jgi:hypothetical protein
VVVPLLLQFLGSLAAAEGPPLRPCTDFLDPGDAQTPLPVWPGLVAAIADGARLAAAETEDLFVNPALFLETVYPPEMANVRKMIGRV